MPVLYEERPSAALALLSCPPSLFLFLYPPLVCRPFLTGLALGLAFGVGVTGVAGAVIKLSGVGRPAVKGGVVSWKDKEGRALHLYATRQAVWSCTAETNKIGRTMAEAKFAHISRYPTLRGSIARPTARDYHNSES